MNTELRKNNAKNDFKKELIKLTTNAIFVKTMKNIRKHKDTQLVAIQVIRNYLVSEPTCHTTNFFLNASQFR